MLSKIIHLSLRNKLIVLLITLLVFGFGIYSVFQISIGAVPDITNNQVQVITTSRNLSTEDIEQYITYPVELEMANLPGVQEIRSISKFGLSVVTIVFEDKMGTYLPRQLIAEKIKSASEKIPEGFGVPEMGPISTGLGEIYQYTLEVHPEFKNQYTVTDLRTIQDWLVKRQLSGIKGVVEVNTWGGFLKQYEVSFKPERLQAMNISLPELLKAVESNNSIAGGAYLEKSDQSFFIRGEGKVENLEDIENILVKNINGTPILVRDVGKVKIGYANRFGAITGNAEGEKVLGQIMMLKGANSNEVIKEVKNRIEIIEKSLPPGVYINGFLERSELVQKTTLTVAENLILGCLIVIFVVILLLGNWRSGLVVASVIPLCLLFAISMMNLMGMDANLMSLGAIDFGIIIDGAVIIVEFVAFSINGKIQHLKVLPKADYQKSMDEITAKGASQMMNSAIFAQLIILIVFIPILSLSGIEGKMFKPMALTFSFALIAAMILCLTYVPVVSSLLLKPEPYNPKSFSNRLISFLKKTYLPVIRWSLQNTRKVLMASAGSLVLAILVFSRMGGEFIPTLDEGDFVIQPVLKTGTSLSKTIEITTKIESIVLNNFPEVSQVVSRIGAAEVPTDPMSMEETDIIVKLKPKKNWVSAKSKDELADLIKEKLQVQFPEVEIEFTQPIEMRFNELISGTRSDIGIKLYGDDLEILARKTNEIFEKIKHVEGASDIIIEKTEGLPQISIVYNRSQLARYGINIDEVNQMVSTAFAGNVVGTVFEGEKRFELVVRMDSEYRKNIDNVKNLYLKLSNGSSVPMRELADIQYKSGPAKISRDNTNRRIVIGVNVRNRDMQSVVHDMKNIIDQDVNLPSGYYVTYGGQFENLESAKQRLMVAIPVSLLLIFLMLYFAFSSIKQALLVYTAIPLASVGGILLLWMRDLPFSISAGVGFIALFGIAVLNGIVLIEHLKELRNQSFVSIDELIIKGTTDRLRAVLLTASAAALGFLPMAISTSAGAEVQRPLATVVIGGLITATLLTMVVLPVLFKWVEQKKFNLRWKIKPLLLWIFIYGFSFQLIAQNPPEELNIIITQAYNQNFEIKALQKQIEAFEVEQKTAFQLNKTGLYYSFDQNNLTIENIPLHVFGISQDFKFPTYYKVQKELSQNKTAVAQSRLELLKNRLAHDISKIYNEIVYMQNLETYYIHLDTLYKAFAQKSSRKYELGETNYLEKITAESKYKQIQTQWAQIRDEKNSKYHELKSFIHSDEELFIRNNKLEPLFETPGQSDGLIQNYFEKVENQLKTETKLQRQNYLPDMMIEYFQGDNKGVSNSLYGIKFGVAIPLFLSKNEKKITITKLNQQSWNDQKFAIQQKIIHYVKQKEQERSKYQQEINYYLQTGKKLSEEIMKVALSSFKNGEIDYFQYIISLENAIQIELNYLNALVLYNQILLEIQYLNLP